MFEVEGNMQLRASSSKYVYASLRDQYHMLLLSRTRAILRPSMSISATLADVSTDQCRLRPPIRERPCVGFGALYECRLDGETMAGLHISWLVVTCTISVFDSPS